MHSVLYGKLAHRLEGKRQELMTQIGEGGGAPDFPSYKYLVGYLDGIKEALYQAEEVDNEMIGARPRGPTSNSPSND